MFSEVKTSSKNAIIIDEGTRSNRIRSLLISMSLFLDKLYYFVENCFDR